MVRMEASSREIRVSGRQAGGTGLIANVLFMRKGLRISNC